jgi:hypothetical protein
MTYIDAEAVRAFVDIVRTVHLDDPLQTEEYYRGARSCIGMMDAYLEAVMGEPESDRQVAA